MNEPLPRPESLDQPGHPSLDRLADLAAGLPDPVPTGDGHVEWPDDSDAAPRQAPGRRPSDPDPVPDAAAHVAHCGRCAALIEQLTGPAHTAVRRALSEVGPAPLPTDVAERVRLTVEALPAPGATGPPAAGAEAGATTGTTAGSSATNVLPAERRSRRTPVLGLAAALVGVLVLVGIGVTLSQRTTESGTSTSTAAGASVAGPAVPRVVSTGTDWDKSSLRARVPALLARSATDGASAGSAGLVPAGSDGPDADVHGAALQACLAEVAGPGGPPALLVDEARYAGQPALVVVLPGSSPSSVDVYVVGAGCTTGDSQLLVYLSVAR